MDALCDVLVVQVGGELSDMSGIRKQRIKESICLGFLGRG